MRSLANDSDRQAILERLNSLRPENQARWGSMSPHQMVCHLSDSLRAALGQKQVSSSSTLFKRTVYKWAALWLPLKWPHGITTRPELDQHLNGTRPTEYSADVDGLRALFDQFCCWPGAYAPHTMFGPMTRGERMRHAYLHMDHHLRQFGA